MESATWREVKSIGRVDWHVDEPFIVQVVHRLDLASYRPEFRKQPGGSQCDPVATWNGRFAAGLHNQP
jgi:hypothetical protein